MNFNVTMEERARQPIRCARREIMPALRMTSTTTRYSIKPKTLTLLELCQSVGTLRRPPPSLSSYQYQSSPNAAQILTRRLYLHPIILKSNFKQNSPQIPTTTADETQSEVDQRHQSNSDKNRTKTRSSDRGLAVLSSSFPLMARIHAKPDTRHSSGKGSMNTDDHATNSDFDASSTSIYLTQSMLPSIARGTKSSTHTMCSRPLRMKNPPKIHPKVHRRQKIDVWHNFDRPLPIDPPTTPFDSCSTENLESEEVLNDHSNLNFIQEIKIYKRNPRRNSIVTDEQDYDDYIYNHY